MMQIASNPHHTRALNETNEAPKIDAESAIDGASAVAFAEVFEHGADLRTPVEGKVGSSIDAEKTKDLETRLVLSEVEAVQVLADTREFVSPSAEQPKETMILEPEPPVSPHIAPAFNKVQDGQNDIRFEAEVGLGHSSEGTGDFEARISAVQQQFQTFGRQHFDARLIGELGPQAGREPSSVVQYLTDVEISVGSDLDARTEKATEATVRGALAIDEGARVFDVGPFDNAKSIDGTQSSKLGREFESALHSLPSAAAVTVNELEAGSHTGGLSVKSANVGEVVSGEIRKTGSIDVPLQRSIGFAEVSPKTGVVVPPLKQQIEPSQPRPSIGLELQNSPSKAVPALVVGIANTESVLFNLPAASHEETKNGVTALYVEAAGQSVRDQIKHPSTFKDMQIFPVQVTSQAEVLSMGPQLQSPLPRHGYERDFISLEAMALVSQAEVNRSFGQAVGQNALTLSAEHAVMIVRDTVDALVSNKKREIELQLHPKELGRLRFVMSPGEGQMLVQIFAERPETLEALRRHAELLTQELFSEGFENTNFSFEQDTSQNKGSSLEHSKVADQDETGGAPKTVVAYEWRDPDGRLDIRI